MSVIAEFYALIKGDSSQLQGELNKTKAALTGTSNQVKGLSASSVLGFAAMAGAAYKAGQTIMQLANETMKYGLQVHDMSLITGDTAESTSMLIQAADDARVSYEQLTTAMRMAVKQGIDPSLEGMMKLADQYVAIQGPIERSQFLIQTFGRSGLEMGKMLENGSAGIKASADEAQRLGLVLSKDAIKNAENYYKELDKLGDSFKGLKQKIGNDLLPTLTEFFQSITGTYLALGDLNTRLGEIGTTMSETSPKTYALGKMFSEALNSAFLPLENLKTSFGLFRDMLVESGYIDDYSEEVDDLGKSMSDTAGDIKTATSALDGFKTGLVDADKVRTYAEAVYQLSYWIRTLQDKTVTITTILRTYTLTGSIILDGGGGGTNMKAAFARASGGYMASGGYANGSYLVGERGPEVVTPSRDGFVAPNETASIKLDDSSIEKLSRAIGNQLLMTRA